MLGDRNYRKGKVQYFSKWIIITVIFLVWVRWAHLPRGGPIFLNFAAELTLRRGDSDVSLPFFTVTEPVLGRVLNP